MLVPVGPSNRRVSDVNLALTLLGRTQRLVVSSAIREGTGLDGR